jgi:hypothetical protein
VEGAERGVEEGGVRIEGDGSGEEEGVYPEPMFDFAERRGISIEGMKKAYQVGLYCDDPGVLDGSWKAWFDEASDEKDQGSENKGKQKGKGQATLDGHFKRAKT